MKISLILMQISFYAMQEIKGNCKESRELESTCGNYCFKAVKPILDHTKMLQSQVDGNEYRERLNNPERLNNIEQLLHGLTKMFDSKFQSIEQKIEEHIRKVKEELQYIKGDIRLLQQKCEHLNITQNNVDDLHKNTQHMIRPLREMLEIIDKRPFQKIGTKYYLIEHSEKLNWFQANKKCGQLGGHLISLQNEGELKAVSAQLTEPHYWTDINDDKFEGDYVSSTSGKRATFLKWNNGEPNNIVQEDCILLLAVGSNYLMNDGTCSSELNYICEKE